MDESASSAKQNDSTTHKVLHVATLHPFHPRDPRRGVNFAHSSLIGHLYEPAYRCTSQAGDIEPVLLDYPLRKEAPSHGMTVLSAAVRPDTRFSDGTEVTAQHIASSLEKTPTFVPHAMAAAQGNRVLFTLKRPNVNFKFVLARFDHPIIFEKGAVILGTGPYMLGPQPTPGYFRLLRNPYYHKKFPGPDEIEFRAYPLDAKGKRQKLVEAVNCGQVDFTEDLSREDITSAQRMRQYVDPGFCTAILFFNTQRQPFTDPAARIACAMAIDRKALATQSFANAQAFAANFMLPPSLGSGVDGIPYDLPAARALLAASNIHLDAIPLVLRVVPMPRPHLPDPHACAELLAQQLAQIGCRVEIKKTHDVAEFYEITARGAYDLLLSGWIPDTSDRLDMLETLFCSYCIPDVSKGATRGANFARWSNADFDSAVEVQRNGSTSTSWKKICQLLAQEVPAFPLMYGPHVGAVSWRVKKFPRDYSLFRPFLTEIEL